ncbi:DUF3368 domain-containing protein [Marivirga tractuosa]|uniref:DUF3368 domain-containing protein n=1 Tax=Marivirga tractuosa TaxID=1006 RepID=UPI0035CEDFBB
MNNGLVIADAGPIFSLAIVNELELLNQLFNEIKISKAVWDEITLDKSTEFYNKISLFFKDKVSHIKGFNELTFVMDYGESESVILYKELNADFLLIDDKKARNIAENFDINCIGTLGILSVSKDKGLIKELRPLFLTFLDNNRYYSIKLLNKILQRHKEDKIKLKA